MSEREQLEQSIAALEAQRAILGDAVVEPAIAALREKLAALETPAAPKQRKLVTVLFADVSGFTAMSERMDAEDMHDTMNTLWAGLDGAVTAYGGLIDKHIGDAVMALFGAPTAHEDDPERAIRAALAMQAELAAFRQAYQSELKMRIGINTGPVLLGEVGTTAEYTAMGDTVNLASRLEHAAPVGGILISHDTYRFVRGIFEVQPLEPIQIRGKTEPMQVYVVEKAKPRAFRPPTRGVAGIETRMIGREAELQRLQKALNGVNTEGKGGLVTIVGDAGMGKSRLLHEFRNWLESLPQRVTTFRGRSTQEMSKLPYSLIRDMLAVHFEIRDSDSAATAREKLEMGIVDLLGTAETTGVEEAHFIGQLIGLDFSDSPHLRGIVADARQIRDRAFHHVAQFLVAMMRDRPVVICLEDIHWADDGSLDLMDYLIWECRDAPLLIVALTRGTLFEWRPSWGQASSFAESDQRHIRLELQPLSIRDSRRLVEEILRMVDEVPPDLRDLIVRGAEGNPFYVEELIKMLIEDGVIVRGEERWRVEMAQLAEVRVPPTLTGVLQARLDSLPSLERETLQRASVVGRVFWDSAVARIYETATQRKRESETREALKASQGRELIFERQASAFAEAQEYIFKHAILRDVTYESVLKRLRRRYHAQVASWLIEYSGERVGEYAGLIGEHFERADKRAQAAEWFGRAGKQAQDTYALEAALGYYQKGLALAERWEWLRGQVSVLHILGRRDQELAALKMLEGVPAAPVFDVAFLWGQYYEAIGDYDQGQAVVERALEACQDEGEVVDQVRCLALLGSIARRQGDYDHAKERYQQALALLQVQETYTDEQAGALAQVLNGLGFVHRNQGDFEQARVYCQRALKLSRSSGDRRGESETLNSLGVTAYYERDFAAAVSFHQQALEMRRAIGDRAGEGTSLYNLALVALETGDYGQAREYLSQALVIQQAVGNRWEEVNVWNALGGLYHFLGDLAMAQDCLQQGLKLSQEIGDEGGQAVLLTNLGTVVRDRGDLGTAEKLLSDGLALAQGQDDKYMASYFLSHLAITSFQAGQLEQAIEQANAALTMRQELDLRLWTTGDLATLASAHLHAGEGDEALGYARQALTILDECGGEGPESPHRDYFVCYQVASAAEREAMAQAALQASYDLVMARAEKITDPGLRQSFLERVSLNREIVAEYESR